jgi:O-antigen/teichoic acid export membrane protein
VVRFVSADQPRGLHEEASRAVSAALWFRLWLAGVVLLVSLGLSLLAPRIFNIPTELHAATRVAILLSGANVGLSLLCGVFSGVLNALLRFDLLAISAVGLNTLNAAGLVILLGRGRGIVAMALWQLFVGLMNAIFLYKSTFRVYPQLSLLLRPPGRELIRKFGGYSLFLLVNAAAGQVNYHADNIVIGAVLPVGAVTLYALGFAPTQYLRQIVSSLAVTLLPAASTLSARGDHEQLRRLLIQGTRAVMVIALTVEAGFLFRGKTFISLWMGPQYRETSGQVLQVLTLSWFNRETSFSGHVF